MTSAPPPLPAARAVCARGAWTQPPRDVVVLDFDARHRRRVAMRGVHGLAFLLDLAEATALRGGDALVLDDGALVEIVAAPEPLVEVSASDPAAMVRIAWHLGNRHLPVQLAGRRLRLRRDHVIEAMIAGLGGRLVEIDAPFDPEGGAYAGGHGHGHDHAHDHHHRDHRHD
ncbi:MAG: urease accessory protein UreE [Caulobacteraceae bacterium]|nr:urease accessory protein UreE [Caulobacter sp.]